MKSKQEYIALLKEHTSELRNRFGITSIRLFGSVAMGTNHEGSDIDLLVEMPANYHNTCEANDYLEELLGCDVDLIRKHDHLRPNFLAMINKYGINI